MGKWLKFKALFLLSVISLIILQNALPHLHHSHDTFNEIILASSGQHDHDHLDEGTMAVHEVSFLHQLVDSHTHSSPSHEITKLSSTDTRLINISVFLIFVISLMIRPEKLDSQVWSFFQDGIILSPHSSGLTLRGPPFLPFS